MAAVAPPTTAARTASDAELVRAWQRAHGARKAALLRVLLEKKRALIRRLTEKAAFAEKTDAAEEDLLQAGTIGFLRAIEDFDTERGLSIATYAAWWIKHEVQRAARSARVVTLPRIRLTNEERTRVLVALSKNRDVTAAELGLPETKVAQVRASYGVTFVPAETNTRGDSAFERTIMRSADEIGPEEALDQRRRLRVLEHVVARVRAGESADEIGIDAEAYSAAREIVERDEEDERMVMEQQQEQANESGPALAKGRTHEERAESARRAWEKRRRAAAKKKVKPAARRAAYRRPTARDRVARRLAELDVERALLEQLRDAPDEVLERVRKLL